MGNLARKASDMIRETSGRWLNIDPRHPIQIGDYGKIDLETGRFVSHGNIYSNEEVKALVPDILDHPPRLGKVAREEKLKSKHASWSFDVDPEVSVTNVLDGSVQLQFEVASGRRAAYLITKTSRTDYLPTDQLLKKLSNVRDLAGMHLVTERTICCGYSFGITTIGGKNIRNRVNTTSMPHGNSDVQWSAFGNAKDFTYVATLSIKRMNPYWENRITDLFPFRDAFHKVEDKDLWIDATPPWAPLDEEGNEELPEDEVI